MELLTFEGPVLLAVLVIVSLIVMILAEAVVMILFKLNRFGKAFLDAVMANIGSILLAILLFLVFNKAEFEDVSQLTELFVLYFIASLFEGWIVKLLNNRLRWGRILLAS